MVRIKHLGTYIPLLIFVAMLLAVATTLDGVLGWERVTLYEVTAISALLGGWALIQMARLSHGQFPSVFLVTLIYQKVFLFIFWQAVTLITYHTPPVATEGFWQILAYGFLLDSSVTMVIVNGILFFGRKRGWLEREVDPVPFRSFMRRK